MFLSKSCFKGYLFVMPAGKHLVTVIRKVPEARLTGLQFKQSRLADGWGLTIFLTCWTASCLPKQLSGFMFILRIIWTGWSKSNTWKSGLCMFSWPLYLGWWYDVRRHFRYENIQTFLNGGGGGGERGWAVIQPFTEMSGFPCPSTEQHSGFPCPSTKQRSGPYGDSSKVRGKSCPTNKLSSNPQIIPA